MNPSVDGYHDSDSGTVTYLVACPATGACAIIDPVLGFDPVSGRTSTAPVEAVISAVLSRGLHCEWILETHVHADHLSAAPHVQARLGGKIGIGASVEDVKRNFGKLFNFGLDAPPFDCLFVDGEGFTVGLVQGQALATPGHTPDGLTYVLGDAAFVGDTVFMPDAGTARCDFPGGDAGTLYRSIHRILSLPPETRIFVCHDYKAAGREAFAWETTVAEQRSGNIHVREGVLEADYVALRRGRDASLPLPRLMLPSVQVNLRAGHLPTPDGNGVRYILIPLNEV